MKVPNPYKQPAQVGQGGSALTRALVVNIQDPLKAGRVQIRVTGHMDDQQQIPDDKLPWVKIANPTTSASLQTSTTTHGLLPGSMVSCQQYGDQDWIITGSIPNDRKDSEQSIHPATQGKGATDSIHTASQGSTEQKGDGTFAWPMPLKDLAKIKTTIEAMNIRQQGGRNPRRTADPVEEAKNKNPIPQHYGGRTTLKDGQGGTIGTTKFPNAKNAQKFIQSTIQNKSAIIPSALAAIEQLKKVNGNPTSINSVGAGNLMGMISQLAALFKGGGGSEEEKAYSCDELKELPPVKLTRELKKQLDRCLVLEQMMLHNESEDVEEPVPETVEEETPIV
jgi:hypothetical protein